MQSWNSYQEAKTVKSTSHLLKKSLTYTITRNNALEIGAGSAEEAQYIVNEGNFKKITIVDPSPLSIKDKSIISDPRFQIISKKVEDYDFRANSFDFVYAKNSLFFCDRSKLSKVIESALLALKPNGLFVADFLGPNDDWRDQNTISVLQKDSLLGYLSRMEILLFHETEFDEPTAFGRQKYWHYFRLISKKPA